jgi:hypothetical protein
MQDSYTKHNSIFERILTKNSTADTLKASENEYILNAVVNFARRRTKQG